MIDPRKKITPPKDDASFSLNMDDAEHWTISSAYIQLSRTPAGFSVQSLIEPELLLSWNPANTEEPWTLASSGKTICSMPGIAPPLDPLAFLKASAPLREYAQHDSARSLAGLSIIPHLPPTQLRALVSHGAMKGDPFTSFCALCAGADIFTPIHCETIRHPVSAALDRKTNDRGHARIKRTLPETRAWLDFLAHFGGTIGHRDLGRDNQPHRRPVGAEAAYSGDEGRHAVLERGMDLAPELNFLFKTAGYKPESADRALSLISAMLESGTTAARDSIGAAGQKQFDERDKSRENGRFACCAYDRAIAGLLAKGNTAAFALALHWQPRILRDFALESGITQWLDTQRVKAIKGPKPADAFCKEISKIRASLASAGISHAEFDQVVGYALASRCIATTDSAYADAQASSALSRIDLSFLDPQHVAAGANRLRDSVEYRGPYEVAILLSTGVLPSQIPSLSQALEGAAAQLFRQAEEKEQAYLLRDQLDAQTPSKTPVLKKSHSKRTL